LKASPEAYSQSYILGFAVLEQDGPAANRGRVFELSKDSAIAKKLHDIVGLYVSPLAHAVVLSVDEKSQNPSLDRTQPGMPLKKGRGGTPTHDYKRHGTTTLFVALGVRRGMALMTEKGADRDKVCRSLSMMVNLMGYKFAPSPHSQHRSRVLSGDTP